MPLHHDLWTPGSTAMEVKGTFQALQDVRLQASLLCINGAAPRRPCSRGVALARLANDCAENSFAMCPKSHLRACVAASLPQSGKRTEKFTVTSGTNSSGFREGASQLRP